MSIISGCPLELKSSFDYKMIIRMIFMRKKRMIIIWKSAYIFNLPRVTFVVIYCIICTYLIDTFLSQLICLSCLHLKNRSLLFCCQNLWMLWVYVYCLEQSSQFSFVNFKVFEKLKNTKNFIFLRQSYIWVKITWKNEFVALNYNKMINH